MREVQLWKLILMDMNIRSIILKSVFALVFLYGLYLLWAVFAFGGGCKNKSPETHILPYGYIGKVYIIFNQKDGFPKKFGEDGSRTYRIPKSGVLKTKIKENYGWIDAGNKINFFYERDDSLILLEKLFTEQEFNKKLDSNRIVVFEYGNVAELNFEFEGDILTYIVDSLKNFDKRDYLLTKERFENWDK